MPSKKTLKTGKKEPNHSTHSLIFKPSIIIALDRYDERIVHGIHTYAREKNWHISPYFADGRFVPHGWPGDGAITCYSTETASCIDKLDMPVVDISYRHMQRKAPRVQVDNDAICKLAADHFLERGYKSFAFYSCSTLPLNNLRNEAFKNYLLQKGIPKDNILEIRQSQPKMLQDWDQHKANIITKVNQLPRPIGIFAGQDDLGASLIEMCTLSGIQVPEEIAILGADNTELLCERAPVPLSSIRTRLTEVGYRAAETLDRLMSGEIDNDEPTLKISPHGITNRQSTDILAIDHPAVITAVRYIKQHFSESITIDDIIEYTGLSKRGLEKAFEKHLGRTPASELRRVRIDEAKRLLTETNDKTDSIALDCGYSNSSNLSCAFRRDTNLSPRSYRMKFSKVKNNVNGAK